MSVVKSSAGVVAAAGLGALGWALLEAQAYTLRQVQVPVLPTGSAPIKLLHLSDLHFTPGQRRKVDWIRELAKWEPDLVVTTGDNLAHPAAVPTVAAALAPFLELPGFFVYGSNDYYGPRPRNPLVYFSGPTRKRAGAPVPLPTADLTDVLTRGGWHNLNNARAVVSVRGNLISAAGLDDPHIGRDELPAPAEAVASDLRLGVVHAPYAHALGALYQDGANLLLAGHTHGGQVCVPGYGALVTNCDLDRARAKGLSTWAPEAADPAAYLHVSAGLGTSPYAPIRFACRPEATLMTLVASTGDSR